MTDPGDITRWLPDARAGSREAVGQILEACRAYLLMIARQAVPPGIALWQPLLGIMLVLMTTLLCIYAAGCIFDGRPAASLPP